MKNVSILIVVSIVMLCNGCKMNNSSNSGRAGGAVSERTETRNHETLETKSARFVKEHNINNYIINRADSSIYYMDNNQGCYTLLKSKLTANGIDTVASRLNDGKCITDYKYNENGFVLLFSDSNKEYTDVVIYALRLEPEPSFYRIAELPGTNYWNAKVWTGDKDNIVVKSMYGLPKYNEFKHLRRIFSFDKSLNSYSDNVYDYLENTSISFSQFAQNKGKDAFREHMVWNSQPKSLESLIYEYGENQYRFNEYYKKTPVGIEVTIDNIEKVNSDAWWEDSYVFIRGHAEVKLEDRLTVVRVLIYNMDEEYVKVLSCGIDRVFYGNIQINDDMIKLYNSTDDIKGKHWGKLLESKISDDDYYCMRDGNYRFD